MWHTDGFKSISVNGRRGGWYHQSSYLLVSPVLDGSVCGSRPRLQPRSQDDERQKKNAGLGVQGLGSESCNFHSNSSSVKRHTDIKVTFSCLCC